MKHLRERILALGMALCLCLSICAIPANAVNTEEMPREGTYGTITLSRSLRKSNDTYTVSYTAKTKMVNWLAQAAAVCKDDSRMKNLRFTCTLKDALTAKLTSVGSVEYNFDSAKYNSNDIFVLDDDDEAESAVKVESGSIKLRYKLNPTVLADWDDETTQNVKDALRQQMTMEASKIVSAAEVGSISSSFKSTARIDITMENNGYIPFYKVTSIFAAYGEYPVSGGGSTKPQEPQPEEPTVVVDTGKTEGGEVVISNPDAKPGDTVEITAKPETEKYVHHIDVRDENGDKVPMTYVGKGEYSFVMPEGEVTITPSFQTQATDPAVSGVSRLLNADDHVAFMQGFGTGDFRPTASITRAQVATIFYRLLLDQNVEITKSFDDVSEDYWAHNAIAALASLGILNGMTEDHYDPNRQITRAQFAAICARFAYALTGLGGQTSFTDVPTDHWAHDEIETAVSYGWINGYDDGSFNPGAPITRAQAATIVNRMFARIADQIVVDNGERRDYSDVNDAYWAWYDIQEASTGHDFEDETGFRHEYWEDSEVAALKS